MGGGSGRNKDHGGGSWGVGVEGSLLEKMIPVPHFSLSVAARVAGNFGDHKVKRRCIPWGCCAVVGRSDGMQQPRSPRAAVDVERPTGARTVQQLNQRQENQDLKRGEFNFFHTHTSLFFSLCFMLHDQTSFSRSTETLNKSLRTTKQLNKSLRTRTICRTRTSVGPRTVCVRDDVRTVRGVRATLPPNANVVQTLVKRTKIHLACTPT